MRLDKDQILDALGFETGPRWLGIALAGFGVGCVVGAVTAVLLAPRSGSDLRADLADRGRDLLRRGRREIMEEEGKGQTPSY
jgi:hypothetical protein